MFGNMDEIVKEGNKRWKEIEDLAEELRPYVAKHGDESDIKPDGHLQAIIMMAQLLLLMVDHMKPMNPSQEQVEEATKGIADLLQSLKK